MVDSSSVSAVVDDVGDGVLEEVAFDIGYVHQTGGLIGEVSVKMNAVGEKDKTHAKAEVLILGNEAAEENFLASKREIKVVRELSLV